MTDQTPERVQESPLVCVLDAIAASDRPRYNELRSKVAHSVTSRDELADGFALRLDLERVALAEVADWIAMERRCCPFFDFRLEVAREAGPVVLTISGRAGVKAFLAQAFAAV
jgi:hypothetical protein